MTNKIKIDDIKNELECIWSSDKGIIIPFNNLFNKLCYWNEHTDHDDDYYKLLKIQHELTWIHKNRTKYNNIRKPLIKKLINTIFQLRKGNIPESK